MTLPAIRESRQDRRKKRRLYLTRDCGDCRACCTAVGVVELNKPDDVPCPHLREEKKGGGCGIYETRPQSCRDFACAWRAGDPVLQADEKPEDVGILVQVWTLGPSAQHPGLQALLVRQAYEGGFENERIEPILRRLSAQHLVVLMTESRYVLGPKEKIARFSELPEHERP